MSDMDAKRLVLLDRAENIDNGHSTSGGISFSGQTIFVEVRGWCDKCRPQCFQQTHKNHGVRIKSG